MFLALTLWQSVLSIDGRVDILACDVNSQEALLKQFLCRARASNIRVCYSSNRTGGTNGDWVLECSNYPAERNRDIADLYFERNAAADIKTSFFWRDRFRTGITFISTRLPLLFLAQSERLLLR